MAILKMNTLVDSMHGKLGRGLVLRTVRGKIIASSKPERVKQSQSEEQRATRTRFKEATAYAKAMMLIPEKKSFYQHKAKKLKLPNAYTAAITDFMRKPAIEIEASGFYGLAGDTIKVTTSRKGFRVNEVKLIIKDVTGNIVAAGEMTDKQGTENWRYNLQSSLPPHETQFIALVLVRYGGSIASREFKFSIPASFTESRRWHAPMCQVQNFSSWRV